MTKAFGLRPLKQGGRADLNDIFKLHVPQKELSALGIYPGELCRLESADGDGGGPRKHAVGRAIQAQADVRGKVVQVAQAFKEMHGLRFEGDYVLRKAETTVEEVRNVTITEVATEEGAVVQQMDQVEAAYWMGFVCRALQREARFVAVGMPIENIQSRWQNKSFRIAAVTLVSGEPASVDAFCRFTETSSVVMGKGRAESAKDRQELSVDATGVGGLESQLARLNQEMARYRAGTRPLRRNRGILLHGPSGTGKTLLMNKIIEAPWKKVFKPSPKYVEKAFVEASVCEPSLIVLDDLGVLGQENPGGEGGFNRILAQSIKEGFETVRHKRVLVMAEVQNLRSVPPILRGPSCFKLEIELPVPDSRTRMQILEALLSGEGDVHADEGVLKNFSDRTHGYSGADLEELFFRAIELSEDRYNHSQSSQVCSTTNGVNQISEASELTQQPCVFVASGDFELAFSEVRPSAMNEVFLETPKIRWEDVGGQQSTKDALTQAVSWPLKYSEGFEKNGLRPTKGMLLYGPPGCSKTLIAAAVANEAGLNFLAVKGAEVLSMYVGESERKVRGIFSKARAAQPSIVFFDEIDAIGAVRESGSGGVHVLTTLLNELDGIEAMRGVFVLAATNKPWVLDPALMRPGRLDKIVYVPLPDEVTRRDIVSIRLKSMVHADDVDVERLARETEGCSGAEIAELCQRAGYLALGEQIEAKVEAEEMPMSQRHFDKMLPELTRGVPRDMVRDYEEWSKTIRR